MSEKSMNGLDMIRQLLDTAKGKHLAEVQTKVAKKHQITTEVEFSTETQKITIPAGMSKLDAANDLINQFNNEEQTMDFDYAFHGWDWKDALRAFRIVTEEKFGWIKGESGWSNPTEISIVTDIKNGQKVMENAFYGALSFPAWDDCKGSVGVARGGVVTISVTAKRRFGAVIQTYYKEIEQFLQNNSIYKNKTVLVTITDDRLDLEIAELKRNDLIVLNEKERSVIERLIVDQFDDVGKRTNLFTGNYGNGKTETAQALGMEAVERGLSFFYLKTTQAFAKCLTFAKRYEPAVVFVEDIDEIASGENRTTKMNEILNTLDGIETKGRKLTVILTTNHEKKINKAIRRPGRIDLIVNFENPNNETKEKIFRKYFANLAGADQIDYSLIIPLVPDVSGSVIAEMAKRAQLMARKHDNSIETDDVVAAIASLEFQIKFMEEGADKVDPVKDAMDTLREYLSYNLEFKAEEKKDDEGDDE